MHPTEYQHAAMRTECNQSVSRLRILGNVSLDGEPAAVPMLTPIRALHACIGMSSEVGEITSLVQKWLWYGREIQRSDFAGEVGDLLWYIAQLCESLGLDMGKVLEANIEKLRTRYPDKFQDLIERDKEAERAALEAAGGECVVMSTECAPARDERLHPPHVWDYADTGYAKCRVCGAIKHLASGRLPCLQAPSVADGTGEVNFGGTVSPTYKRKLIDGTEIVQDGHGFGHVELPGAETYGRTESDAAGDDERK